MSDQPKSTGDAHRLFEPEDEPNIISRSTPTQPKPTTGEWTAESALDLFYSGKPHLVFQTIADAHNAALDAAEEKYENATDNLYRDIKRLNNQLAAEREKIEPAGKTFKSDAEILRLREKVQTLADALKKYMLAMDSIYNHNLAARQAVIQHFGTIHHIAFDELAKVGK